MRVLVIVSKGAQIQLDHITAVVTLVTPSLDTTAMVLMLLNSATDLILHVAILLLNDEMLTVTGNYIINVYIYLHQILLHKIRMNVQQTMAMVHVIRLASIHLDHTNVAVLLVMLWLPMGGHVLVSSAWNKLMKC